MQNAPRPRRSRGGRHRQRPPDAVRTPVRPARPDARPPRPQQGRAVPARPAAPPDRRPRQRQRRPRPADEIRAGTPCVILVDCREGEPDRSGAAAVFDGYFDLETGEPRRSDTGLPRLRVAGERLWGFECWWRTDPGGKGLTPEDHEEIETSKRLLRGLLRDARRAGRAPMRSLS